MANRKSNSKRNVDCKSEGSANARKTGAALEAQPDHQDPETPTGELAICEMLTNTDRFH
jgi:hypothetical protein